MRGLVLGTALSSLAAAPPAPGPDPTLAAARVARCGVGRVEVVWSDELEEPVLTPARRLDLTDRQLACVDRAAGPFEVALPAATQSRLERIRIARLRPVMLRESRRRLAQRHLVPPRYRQGPDADRAFVTAVERRCGPHAEGAFDARWGWHAISPDWVRRELRPGDPAAPALACITDMALVAGYPFGFIGNEAATPSAP